MDIDFQNQIGTPRQYKNPENDRHTSYIIKNIFYKAGYGIRFCMYHCWERYLRHQKALKVAQ
jgi:hypothetical protein